MAERKVKIVAIIDAEGGDYEKMLTSVQGKTTLFGNVVQGIFQGIGQAIYRHFVGGLVDAGKKMVAMIGDSIGKTADLEYALAEVATLGVKDMEKMRRGVLDLSYAIGEDAVKGTKALYQAISAGVPEENVLTFIETASKGAIAGLTETAVMVNALTTVIAAYNLGWEEAARVSDLLFTTVKYGKTEMSILAPVIGRVAALAKQAGMSLEEMFAWLAKSTLLVRTEEAVTGLRTALQAFIKPTGESVKVLKELDLTWEQMQKTVADEGIAKFLSRLSKDQLPRFLGSIEAIVGTLAVIGGDPGAREFLKFLEEFGKSAGATGTAFGIMVEQFNFQWDLLKRRVKTAKTEIAGPFMEIGKEIVKSVNEWLDMPGPDGRTPIQAFSQWADRARNRVIEDLDLVRKGEKTWGEIISGWIDESTPAIAEAIQAFTESDLWAEFNKSVRSEWEKARPSVLAFAETVGIEIMKGIAKGIAGAVTFVCEAIVNTIESALRDALSYVTGGYPAGAGATGGGIAESIITPYLQGAPGIPSVRAPSWMGEYTTLPIPAEAAKEVAAGLEEAVKAGENYIKIGGEIVTLESMGLDDAAESAAKMAKELDDLGGTQEGYYKIVFQGVETVGKLNEAISAIDTEPIQKAVEETLTETTRAVEDFTGSTLWASFEASLISGWQMIKPSILGSAEGTGREIVDAIAEGISRSAGILTSAINAIISSAMATASASSYRATTSTENVIGEYVTEGPGASPWVSDEDFDDWYWWQYGEEWGEKAGAKGAGRQQAVGGNVTFHIYDARDADAVADKVARKIKELERLGKFSLSPELSR